MGINILKSEDPLLPPPLSLFLSLSHMSFLPFPFSHHKTSRGRQVVQMFRFLVMTHVNIYVTFKVFDLYNSLRTIVVATEVTVVWWLWGKGTKLVMQ